MYKKRAGRRGGGAGGDDTVSDRTILEQIRSATSAMDADVRAKVELMIQDFLDKRKQQRDQYDNDEKKEEAKIHNFYRNRLLQIPTNVQQMKIGEIVAAGGRFDIKSGQGYVFSIPTVLIHGAQKNNFTVPQQLLSYSAQKQKRPPLVAASPLLTGKKSADRKNADLKRGAQGAGMVNSPLNSSSKRKAARLAAKPSQHALNLSACKTQSDSDRRVTRSTARKPATTATRRADNQENVANNLATGTPRSGRPRKQPRQPQDNEDIEIVSVNGTPLTVDYEWLKSRLNPAAK